MHLHAPMHQRLHVHPQHVTRLPNQSMSNSTHLHVLTCRLMDQQVVRLMPLLQVSIFQKQLPKAKYTWLLNMTESRAAQNLLLSLCTTLVQ